MKKISLKNLNLKEVEQLSREQLKGVLGGFTGGSGTGTDGETTVPLASCSATCADGTSISITDCKGTCSCTDNVGCTCSGTKPVEKSCDPVTP